MQTASTISPASPPTAASIADDRLDGAEAIGRFMAPDMTPREVRRRLLSGAWPSWREGRRYVASKAALRAHWQAKTGAKPEPAPHQPKQRGARRGYRPA